MIIIMIAEQWSANLFPAVAQNVTALRRRRKTAEEEQRLQLLQLEATRERSKP